MNMIIHYDDHRGYGVSNRLDWFFVQQLVQTDEKGTIKNSTFLAYFQWNLPVTGGLH